MAPSLSIREFAPSAAEGAFAALADLAPWEVTSKADRIIEQALDSLVGFEIDDNVAVHRTAEIEPGATIKAPAIIRPNAFVAAGAYLRGGVFVDEQCVVGPHCELKSTLMLKGASVAHLSFVGDSIIGAGANIEAGAVIANTRNEWANRQIRVVHDGDVIDTGCEKFGALIGDGAQIGANAVIAPGALIRPGEVVPRLAHVDQAALVSR